jgi:ribose-phosphate pyrophosphokinase
MIKILKRDKSAASTSPFYVQLEVEKDFLFPGGEVGIQLKTSNYAYKYAKAAYQTIIARIKNSNDVMRLLNVVDALRRFDPTPIRLFMPYVPYSRQDRVCNEGESFALGVFANLINSMNFEKVTIFDPHSDVTPAIINNVEVISLIDVVGKFDALTRAIMQPEVMLIAPDAGSNKKIAKLAGYFSHTDFLRADKLRDLATGNIKETIVYADKLDGKTIVIVDDICDGGRTFTELAKVLKKKGAAKVILFVTHGIFSKGSKPLFQDGIDEIFTTNSYDDVLPFEQANKFTILNLESVYTL